MCLYRQRVPTSDVFVMRHVCVCIGNGCLQVMCL